MTRRARWTARPATAGLVAACSLAFVLCEVALGVRAEEPLRSLATSVWALDDTEVLERAGGLAATRVWDDDQWWRVASCGFLHGSWLHLVLNMMGLWVVGQWTEKVWGPWRQLALFLVASIGGCLASLAWAEAPMVVGASAGIFGVAGALVVARAWGREELQEALEPISARSLGFWLVLWLVVGVLLPLVGVSLLAQAGHVGGLAFGCVAGWAMSREQRERRFRWREWAGWSVIGLGTAGLVAVAGAPVQRSNYHVIQGVESLDAGDFEQASVHFEHALELEDDDGLENAVAYWYAEEGIHLERAEQLVREALAKDPENANYLDTLGWIQCKLGQAAAGEATLEEAEAGRRRQLEVFERILPRAEIPEIEEHLERCRAVGPG